MLVTVRNYSILGQAAARGWELKGQERKKKDI